MAFDTLGRSFLPRGQSRESAGSGNRLEDVLRTISLRLPRILGARPVAPGELLNAQGGSGPFGQSLVSSILSNVLRGAPSTLAAAAAPDPGAPNPLARLTAPIAGGAGIQSPAQLPKPSTKVHTIEVPAPDAPSVGDAPSGPTLEQLRRRLRGAQLD